MIQIFSLLNWCSEIWGKMCLTLPCISIMHRTWIIYAWMPCRTYTCGSCINITYLIWTLHRWCSEVFRMCLEIFLQSIKSIKQLYNTIKTIKQLKCSFSWVEFIELLLILCLFKLTIKDMIKIMMILSIFKIKNRP